MADGSRTGSAPRHRAGRTLHKSRAKPNRLEIDIVLPPERAGEPGFRERFIAESQMVAALDHPSIIPIHDLGSLDDDRLFYTMRVVRSPSLGDVIYDPELRREWTLVRLLGERTFAPINPAIRSGIGAMQIVRAAGERSAFEPLFTPVRDAITIGIAAYTMRVNRRTCWCVRFVIELVGNTITIAIIKNWFWQFHVFWRIQLVVSIIQRILPP